MLRHIVIYKVGENMINRLQASDVKLLRLFYVVVLLEQKIIAFCDAISAQFRQNIIRTLMDR